MKANFIFKFMVITVTLSMLLSLAACGGNKSQSNTQESTVVGNAQTEQTQTAQEDTKPVDPLGKYEPGITVTCVRFVDSTMKYKEGESIDNNIYYDDLQNELGIKLVNEWVTDNTQYANKLNVTIASNNLPDIIPLAGTEMGDAYKQLDMLVKAGAIADLTDTYEKYVSPITKDLMSQDAVAFDTAKVKGKLMALPHINSSVDGSLLLYIRTDWLKKLNLEEPKTFADVLKISEAFTTKDPDGNGKNDTFGLGATKDVWQGGLAPLKGVANSYHVYPGAWIKDESGNLSYGSVMPQMKTVLQTLQELYKKGELDKEFAVKDYTKVAESVTGDKCGMFYGSMALPIWPLQDHINKNPEAEWKILPLLSVDDKPANTQLAVAVSGLYAVNKNCKNPEALVKMMNYASEGWGKNASQKAAKLDARYGIDTEVRQKAFKYTLVYTEPAKKNLKNYLDILDAFKTNDTSKFSMEETKINYNNILKYKNGDKKFWAYDAIFGENSTFAVINNNYVTPNLMVYDKFYGAPTATMSSKWASLKKLEDETTLQIITGEVSVDEFDKFVEKWKALGGDTITNEVNEWSKTLN